MFNLDLTMKKMPLCLSLCLAFLLSFNAYAADHNTQVAFKKGTSSALFSGNIRDYFVHNYVFYAKKGQKLTVTLTGKTNRLWVALFNQHLEDSIDLGTYFGALNNQGAYVLPYSGKYTVRIGQYRAFARRHDINPFNINIAIK